MTSRTCCGVELVRLDLELREALTRRAERVHETTSSVVPKALSKYLGIAALRIERTPRRP